MKRKRTGTSFRRSMTAFVAALSGCAFLAAGGLFLAAAHWVEQDLQSRLVEQIRESAVSNVDKLLEQINAARAILLSDEYYRFLNDNWNLKDKELAGRTKKKILEDFRSLNLSPRVLHRVYLLGKDDQQMNLRFGCDDPLPEGIADAISADDILSQTALIGKLYRGSGQPLRFRTGELEGAVEDRAWAKGRTEALRAFAASLENQVVSCNIVHPVVMILVFNPEYLMEELDIREELATVALYDKQGCPVWTNAAEELPTVSRDESVYTFPIPNTEYTLWVRPNPAKAFPARLLLTIVLGLLLCGSAAMLFYRLSPLAFRPIERLNACLRNKADETGQKAAAPLPETLGKGLSLTRRMFLLLAVLLLVFYGTFGSILYSLIARDVKTQNLELMELQRNTVSVNLQDSVYSLSQFIPQKMSVIRQTIERSQQMNQNANLGRILNLYTDTLYDASYFAVADAQGNLLYQSAFIKEYEKGIAFTRALIEEADRRGADNLLLGFDKGLLNESGAVWLKSVVEDGQRAGYLLIFMDKRLFEKSLQPFRGLECIVTAEDGRPIYDSNNLFDYCKEALGNAATLRDETVSAGPVRYLVSGGELDSPTWSLLVLERHEDAMRPVRRFTVMAAWIMLGVLVAVCLASYLFSRAIAKRLQRLAQSMDATEKAVWDEEKSGNEIAPVVRSYNRMVERLIRQTDEMLSQQKREQQLTLLKTEAELKALQQQVDPHFVFNVLNIIRAEAARDKNEKISDIVGALAQMLRFGLGNTMLVPLQEELANIDRYVSIQNRRYEDDFTFESRVDPELLDLKILRLSVQPLIENAFEHGIFERDENGWVSLTVCRSDGQIEIRVEDNGLGMSPEELDILTARMQADLPPDTQGQKSGNGIGLRNIYQRLRYAYGGRAEMTLESRWMQGTTIVIRIPDVGFGKKDAKK